MSRSTLHDGASGGEARQKPYEEEQILHSVIENALEKWAQKMDDHGFPPKLDILKAMAQELAEKNAKQKGNPKTQEDLAAKDPQLSPQVFLDVWIQSGPSTCTGK